MDDTATLGEITFWPLPPSTTACPCCGGGGLLDFYEIRDIPVQSNALLNSRDEALAFPRGHLKLAYCPGCGFITNTLFDPALEDQGGGYEATQAFSGTFNRFTNQLAQDWINRFRLAGGHKTVVEIGCGQGEFVALLAHLADARGIGIDPRFDPTRHPAPGDERLLFLRDTHSEAHAELRADFICCRHTLEHILDAGRFVRTVRRAIGDRYGTGVGFEVPDTLRVLREGAFWDIYYEHCSYFSPGSLARLFRREAFDVIDLRLVYDGQYLILDAKPAPQPTRSALALEDDLAAVTEAVSSFSRAASRVMVKWRDAVYGAINDGKRVALWGSGSKAVGFLTTLGLSDDVVPCVVDINPHKQGTFLPTTGQVIVAPTYLQGYQPDVVIMMNPVYREEIGRSLRELGVYGELLSL
jgi:SAM-dependent methyltransferase